ncbi:DUF4365 domain-containing protein [Enterococcus hulanensis]|uniref:DUF4365 domain-containing protein n=1 Tax=Enterococcus TaxID=1350 RepID=UPI000B73BB69|nr:MULTISPECIES: DUF4365 domain-containing protein [Enterococcus]MBO0412917.1 DUF4365 domain-containing protein [Enterococcus hulanensis]OTO21862.1 hypothetical protein A5875_003244 [Enterococcus sp. 3H8_DIV0648]
MVIKMEAAPKIENQAELLSTRLAKLCRVNELHDDFGVDFACALASAETGTIREFFAQYKGTEKTTEDEESVSLQLQTATVRQWFKKRSLTVLFYVDLEEQAVYWVDPFEQLFEKVKEITSAQETIVLKVPKANQLSEEDGLPAVFFERIDRFDNYLFNGALERISQDIAIFPEVEEYADEMTVEETEETITIKYKNVCLTAAYPKDDLASREDSCTIQFARLSQKAEAEIKLTPREILDLFYFGKETAAKLGMRKFIKVYLEELNQYFADFGDSIAYLYPAEVDELCSVIDIFIKKYVAKITSFMKSLESFAFEPYRGSHSTFKLMQLEVELWEKIREHVHTYQTSNGTYKDGYIFTPFEDHNRIGIEDELRRELFNVYGSYEQSAYDPEKLVVDVIWEYLDYPDEANKPEQPYNVADTYSFFVNDLLPKFLTNEFTVRKKRLFGTKLIKVYKTLTKEEIEKKIFVPKYKLTQYPNSNSELGSTFYYLAEYMKEKDFYFIEPASIEKLLKNFDHIVQAELKIGGNAAKAWYEGKKKDLLEDLAQMKQEQAKETLSEGYFLANIFSKLQMITRQYKGSFDGKKIRESDLLKDFSELIADYNEDRLIRLLIS